MSRPYVTIRVEIKLGNTWTDITSFVNPRDQISISRGRSDESSTVEPARCSLLLKNKDGRFSMRNPVGPWYGLLSRNTPLRVSVIRDGTTYVRFVGEVSEWPSRWEPGGIDKRVPIEAAGIMRRLGQGSKSLASPMHRAVMENNPVEYWPCEDASGARRLGSALDDGTPMSLESNVQPGSYNGFAGSQSIPLAKNGSMRGYVNNMADTNTIQVRWLMHLPAAGTDQERVLISVTTNGNPVGWRVRYPGSNALQVQAWGRNGNIVFDGAALDRFVPNGRKLYCSLELTQSGGDVQWGVHILEAGTGVRDSAVNTHAGNVGAVTQVAVASHGGLGDAAFGHVSVHDSVTPLVDFRGAVDGWAGETAGDRVERLCREEGIPFRNVGSLTDTEPMGVQGTESLLDELQSCADAEQGILFETRDEVGLTFRTSMSLYNQAPVELETAGGYGLVPYGSGPYGG